jgi:hypothetical protein
MLNAVESYKSIKMDPEERAFYEGQHLIEDDSEDNDLFAPPITEVSKFWANKERIRKEEEQEAKVALELLNGGEEDNASVEEADNNSVEGNKKFDEEPSHPYQIVFGNDISQLVIDKQKARTVLYTGPEKKNN